MIQPTLALDAATTLAEFSLEPDFKSLGARVSDEMNDCVAKSGIARTTKFSENFGPERPFGVRDWRDARAR